MLIPNGRPAAVARVRGGNGFPNLTGTVLFYPVAAGVLVEARFRGLPRTEKDFFGFHIHAGGSCAGESFSNTGTHYDPTNRPHPDHAGDLPPVLRCCGGHGYLAFVTSRFTLREIIGRTVVLHGGADDFHTQPAGDSGEKIGCGVIRRM